MTDLFGGHEPRQSARQSIAQGAVLLRGFALDDQDALLSGIARVADAAPFRKMVTPGGHAMSVAMTNCGSAGWVTDRAGYRYSSTDPESGLPWPAMPDSFLTLARRAALQAGYPDFHPDACLINRYTPGAKMSLHQDRDERDLGQPIVSVSFGLPSTFQFGGLKRGDPVMKYALIHGDCVVWGGPSRLCYHGILALKDGDHPATGRMRLNLTFRGAM